jgi:hypothetical protein
MPDNSANTLNQLKKSTWTAKDYRVLPDIIVWTHIPLKSPLIEPIRRYGNKKQRQTARDAGKCGT